MIKHIFALSVAASLMACSGDSNNTAGTTTSGTTTSGTTTSGTTTSGTTTSGTTTSGTTTSGGTNQSGGTAGVWFGQSDFGEAVVVVDASQQLYGLSSNGANHEAVLGAVGAPLNRYLHRDSSNPAFGDSFTLVGDLPSDQVEGAADTVNYSLSVVNDGQQLNVTGGSTFSLTFAGTNDVEAITLASAAGSYQAQTSFCVSPPAAAACDLLFAMDIAANGTVSGRTEFNGANAIALTGTASEGNGQYLNVSYDWNGNSFAGVLYQDRTTAKLVLNSYVPSDPTQKTITAKMTKQ